jgi:hypothetical protein
MTERPCAGACPHAVVGPLTKVIHGLMAKGKEKSARLQLLITFPELTPEEIDLVVTGRNCLGTDVSGSVGVTCPFRQAGGGDNGRR